MKYIPNSKPLINKEESEKIVSHYLLNNPEKFPSGAPSLCLIGIRGYYSKSMGATPENDINLYDDAIIIIGTDTFKTFNANTDPSFVKVRGRGLAMLNLGVYNFYKGKHRGKYNALRAYPEGVTLDCTREGKPSKCSHINIHKGGTTPSSAGVTWSEGCQTIPSPQWADFIETVYLYMSRNNMKTIKYILMSGDEMNEILK